MPLALVEGMAAGCACIGSDVVGVREVIDPGRTGLLVPESNAAALAQALRQLLTQPALAQSLAQSARQQATTAFDVAVMQTRYADVLRSVHAGQSPKP